MTTKLTPINPDDNTDNTDLFIVSWPLGNACSDDFAVYGNENNYQDIIETLGYHLIDEYSDLADKKECRLLFTYEEAMELSDNDEDMFESQFYSIDLGYYVTTDFAIYPSK